MRDSKQRQKCYLLAFCIVCLFGVVVRGCFPGKTGYMQLAVPAVSADRIEEMTKGMEEYASKPGLYFGGHTLAYDGLEDVYYITQSLEGGAWSGALSSSEGKLYWQKDGYFSCFEDSLAEGHLFSLYCIDSRENRWCSYRVVFTGMPIMVIDTVDGKDIKGGRDGTMRLFDLKFPGRSYTETLCWAAVRGGTSLSYPKQSYKLVLDKKVPLLGMRTDEDWILSALYDDAGLIHNKYSYDVWRDIADSNQIKKDDGTTMEYVELFSNDVYLGVYGLIERIDGKELSLEEGDVLYKCFGYEDERTDAEWCFGLEGAYDIKYPAQYGTYEWQPLKEYLDVFNDITDYGQARSMINLENYVEHNIFILFAYGCDNLVRKNNFYLAQPKSRQEGGYTFSMLPWDCNATWGNEQVVNKACNYTLYNPEAITDPNMWSQDLKALFRVYPDEIKEMSRQSWRGLREEVLSRERLVGMLDEEFDYLHRSGAYERNYRRWPQGTEYWKDEYIYEYVEGRLEFLDDYFQDPYLTN